jgi:hypothetical protein
VKSKRKKKEGSDRKKSRRSKYIKSATNIMEEIKT